MKTLQGMRDNVQQMQEQIRQQAIEAKVEEFFDASYTYYKTCKGGKKCTDLIHELQELGVEYSPIGDRDLGIRDQVSLER